MPVPSGERIITLSDGARIWTTVQGSGPPLVLCHGGPGLWDYLESLADLLSDRFTVIRFDQRACGRSTGDGPFTIAQSVDDLDQLRRALGIESWSVLGHSWGAEIALRYAARHPLHTGTVIYLGWIGAGDGFAEPFVAERQRRLGNDYDRWVALSRTQRTADEQHEWCVLQWRPDFAPTPRATEQAEALWRTRPDGAEINIVAYQQLWADRATEDLLEVAAGIRQPVTMIHGADDPRPWSASGSVHRALPRVSWTVIPGAGHAPWVEQPDATRAAILAGWEPPDGDAVIPG